MSDSKLSNAFMRNEDESSSFFKALDAESDTWPVSEEDLVRIVAEEMRTFGERLRARANKSAVAPPVVRPPPQTRDGKPYF